MDALSGALLALGLAFVVLNGANDGGALVAASLKAPGIRPLSAVVVLSVALGIVPLVLGTTVARTIAEGFVAAPAEEREVLLSLAVAAALVIVGTMTWRGLPTSLTLALVGGLVGAGLGSGYDVSWPTVGLTAAAGVAAPLFGGALGRVLGRLRGVQLRERADAPPVARRVGRVHAAAFGLQAIAYASNDGQKTYAVLAAGALGATGPPSWQLGVVPLLFALGAVVGVRRASRSLGGAGVLRTRPRDEVASEVSSATAVLASAAAGAPVSMTQAVAGALIGSGLTRGRRTVRWRAAASLGLAWVLTLPTSAVVGAGLAAALAAIGGIGE